MAIYTGKTRDGSDVKRVSGFYISEDGKQWSNIPYPINKILNRHLKFTGLTLKQTYQKILDNNSLANKRVQKYLLANYKALNPYDED